MFKYIEDIKEVRNQGELVFDSYSKCYLDQLNTEEEVWVSISKFEIYLRRTYIWKNKKSSKFVSERGLTKQQYYGLIMHLNPRYVEKCHNCGKSLPFIRLGNPYPYYCSDCIKLLYPKKDPSNYLKKIGVNPNSSEEVISDEINNHMKLLSETFILKDNGGKGILKLIQLGFKKLRGFKLNMKLIKLLAESKIISPCYTHKSDLKRFLLRQGFDEVELEEFIINEKLNNLDQELLLGLLNEK